MMGIGPCLYGFAINHAFAYYKNKSLNGHSNRYLGEGMIVGIYLYHYHRVICF